jgi:nitroreductase
MQAAELLSTTRSVRRRLDLAQPVDLDVVKDCLRLALQAPSGGNRQHWRWIVITDPAKRAELGAIYRAAFTARYPPGQQASPPQRDLDSARHLADNLHLVPVLVLACLVVPGGRLPQGSQASLWGSLLPAAWSYMLAARSRGLGTAWTTVHLDREDEVAKLLGLPGDVRQGVLIPTAHARGTFRPAARSALESVLHLDGWRSP